MIAGMALIADINKQRIKMCYPSSITLHNNYLSDIMGLKFLHTDRQNNLRGSSETFYLYLKSDKWGKCETRVKVGSS